MLASIVCLSVCLSDCMSFVVAFTAAHAIHLRVVSVQCADNQNSFHAFQYDCDAHRVIAAKFHILFSSVFIIN